jgi:hypothetical protein
MGIVYRSLYISVLRKPEKLLMLERQHILEKQLQNTITD